MFHLTDSDSAAPTTANWPWGKWVAALCGSAAVFFAIMVLHDESLEPYEDLRRQAAAEPPKEKNGFLLLYSRWEGIPEVSHKRRKLAENMLAGIAPWDPAHLETMRSGREPLHADLEEALSMPEWMDPIEIDPEGYLLRSQSVLLRPVLLLRLEVMRDLTEGREEEAFAATYRLQRLAIRQLEGGGHTISYLSALIMLQNVMELWNKVARTEMNPAHLLSLADWWKDDPPIGKAYKLYLANQADRLGEVIGDYPEKLFLKKNKSQNQFNRAIRNLMLVGLAPYPDKVAAAAAGAAEVTKDSSLFPEWLDFNYHGRHIVSVGVSLDFSHKARLSLFNARAFRVKTALHRWQADHGAGLPPTLQELVPDYLDKVPADPWNGRPVLWDQASGIIYGVGSDWLPDKPNVFHFKDKAALFPNKWFSGDPNTPGLQFARPPPTPAAPAPAPAPAPKPAKP